MLRVVWFEVAIYNHISRDEENEVNIICYRKSVILQNHLLIPVSSNPINSTTNGYWLASHAIITQIEKKERKKKKTAVNNILGLLRSHRSTSRYEQVHVVGMSSESLSLQQVNAHDSQPLFFPKEWILDDDLCPYVIRSIKRSDTSCLMYKETKVKLNRWLMISAESAFNNNRYLWHMEFKGKLRVETKGKLCGISLVIVVDVLFKKPRSSYLPASTFSQARHTQFKLVLVTVSLIHFNASKVIMLVSFVDLCWPTVSGFARPNTW